jgi:hypothetical protein
MEVWTDGDGVDFGCAHDFETCDSIDSTADSESHRTGQAVQAEGPAVAFRLVVDMGMA